MPSAATRSETFTTTTSAASSAVIVAQESSTTQDYREWVAVGLVPGGRSGLGSVGCMMRA
jgi:hypothetical protein